MIMMKTDMHARSRYTLLLAIILTALLQLLSVTAVHAGKNTTYRSPLEVPGATTINVDQAMRMFDQGIKFIDVRNSRFYARGHIPGSIHLDLKYAYNQQALEAVARKDEAIVIYTSSIKCPRAYHAARKALEWGYRYVYYFRDGIVEWRKFNYPEASLKKPVNPE